MSARSPTGTKLIDFQWPKPVTRFFSAPSAAWVFLPIRLWLGYSWLEAGRQKLADSAWMDGGGALQGFWERAVAIPEEGRPSITFDWYRTFLEFMLDHSWYEWFGPLIAVSEFAVGIALILGAFTGIAAAGGAVMNLNFLMAGTASTNPAFFVAEVLVIAGWRVSGYLGLDRVLLQTIGTPWQFGRVTRRLVPHAASSAPGGGGGGG